jgi:hypothetical protein
MALAPKSPELDIDEKSICSFISWFKKLDQVRHNCDCCLGVPLGLVRGPVLTRLLAQSFQVPLRHTSATLREGGELLQDERILRIFDRKGFFSVHGSDTATVAKLYGGSGAVKQLGVAPNKLTSVAMNRSLFEQLLRSVLVEKGDRVVELYEGHGATWRLSR